MNKELLGLCYKDFLSKKAHYDKMYNYYIGDTDANEDYRMLTSRSNTIISVNFMKKFVKEEVSYSIGNDINYVSLDGDEDALDDIRYYLAHINSDHDIDLFKDMLIYSFAYELYSFDNEGNFNMSVLTPNEAYAYENEAGEVEYFMHIYKERFTDETIIKVYDKENIYFYDRAFKEVKESKRHNFSRVPVGIARVSDELEDDSIFKDIKGLQDAYETNLSDISNEISDFRNAYLTSSGARFDEDDFPRMKELGWMDMPEGGKVEWLIKNINDTFIQNTLTTIEEKMYQVSNHINYNEAMPSNASSLALKARLISLEAKCRLNEKAFSNCIQERIRFLFEYISFITNTNYKGDWRNIVIRFTPNIPSDDLLTAQMIQMLDGKVSTKTALSLLSFIENPESEQERLEEEQEDIYGSDLSMFEGEDDEQEAD